MQVDHRVRENSDRDGRFVATVASAFGFPFVQLSLLEEEDASVGGTEASLRKRRYSSISALAQRLMIDTVVTAHTKDDQVETILLRLLSGSASIAAAGMRKTQALETSAGRINLLRPLLNISRAQLVEVLTILKLEHIEDPSNEDVAFRRNRLRHRIIPELQELDPGFSDGLVRSVNHAREDAEVLDRLAVQMAASLVRLSGDSRRITKSLLAREERAIASRIVRAAIVEMIPEDHRELTQERIEAVLGAAEGKVGGIIEMPYGIVATIERDDIVIEYRCKKRAK